MIFSSGSLYAKGDNFSKRQIRLPIGIKIYDFYVIGTPSRIFYAINYLMRIDHREFFILILERGVTLEQRSHVEPIL
jgi:hypothetical protein